MQLWSYAPCVYIAMFFKSSGIADGFAGCSVLYLHINLRFVCESEVVQVVVK